MNVSSWDVTNTGGGGSPIPVLSQSSPDWVRDALSVYLYTRQQRAVEKYNDAVSAQQNQFAYPMQGANPSAQINDPAQWAAQYSGQGAPVVPENYWPWLIMAAVVGVALVLN